MSLVHASVNIGIMTQKVRQKSITHLNAILGSTWDTVNVLTFVFTTYVPVREEFFFFQYDSFTCAHQPLWSVTSAS